MDFSLLLPVETVALPVTSNFKNTLICVAVSALIVVVAVAAAGELPATGLRVTAVESAVSARSSAGRGPVEGQLLVRWRRLETAGGRVLTGGPLHSSFDYWRMELEELPRGIVEVEVESEWTAVPASGWRLELEAVDASSPAATVASAMRRIERLGLDDLEEYDRQWREALLLAAALSPLDRAFVHARFGDSQLDLDRFDESLKHHERALVLRRSVRGSEADLQVASSLDQIGIATWYLGDLDRSRDVWQRALDLRRREASGSLAVAKSLNNLSIVSPDDQARAYQLEALDIRRRLDPKSLATAGLLSNVATREPTQEAGLVLLAEAEAIYRAEDLESLRLPRVWTLQAERYRNLGRPADAERLYYRAIALLEKKRPSSFDLAEASQKLGNFLLGRRDSERAEVYLRQAYETLRELSERSTLLTSLLLDLGLAAKHRGDLDLARQRYLEAVEQGKNHPTDHQVQRWVAIAENNLGSLAQARAKNEEAFRQYESAAQRLEGIGSKGPDLARTLGNLGHLHLQAGALAKAEMRLLRARELLIDHPIPDHELAHIFEGLGELRRRQGRVDEAEELFRKALDIVSSAPLLHSGGAVGRARFWSEHSELISRFAHFLVQQSRPREALTLVENARARSYQLLLASRDLEPASGATPGGRLMADLRAKYDRALLRLGREADPASSEELRFELAELREKMRQVQEVEAGSSDDEEWPSLLGGPDSQDWRAELPTGSALFSYLVGVQETLLLVVTRNGVEALRLPHGEQELERDVEALRDAIGRREGLKRPRFRRVAQRLTRHLLAPAVHHLDAADSIMLIADGPLHRLPFGALADPADASKYWIESKILTQAPSLPALAELRRKPGARQRPIRLAAFAASAPSAEPSAALQVSALQRATRAGLRLENLPHAAQEVEALQELFGPEARSFLGRLATEEQVERVASSASVLHFASHAWVDESFPLDSGLVLAIPSTVGPGKANGVLQAWEILERLQLDAELVTLSGCETGLGRSFSGQGLLGLTRAFHGAGARAVLASLWQVSDASTSVLMQRFYTHLHGGATLGEALRVAQLELLEDGEPWNSAYSSPYHWAGFQLFGDGSTWTPKN